MTQIERSSVIHLASTIAKQMNEQIGDIVGYQVKFQKNFPTFHGSSFFFSTFLFFSFLFQIN